MRRFPLFVLALALVVVGLTGCKNTITFQRAVFSPLAVTASPPPPTCPPPRAEAKI